MLIDEDTPMDFKKITETLGLPWKPVLNEDGQFIVDKDGNEVTKFTTEEAIFVCMAVNYFKCGG